MLTKRNAAYIRQIHNFNSTTSHVVKIFAISINEDIDQETFVIKIIALEFLVRHSLNQTNQETIKTQTYQIINKNTAIEMQ